MKYSTLILVPALLLIAEHGHAKCSGGVIPELYERMSIARAEWSRESSKISREWGQGKIDSQTMTGLINANSQQKDSTINSLKAQIQRVRQDCARREATEDDARIDALTGVAEEGVEAGIGSWGIRSIVNSGLSVVNQYGKYTLDKADETSAILDKFTMPSNSSIADEDVWEVPSIYTNAYASQSIELDEKGGYLLSLAKANFQATEAEADALKVQEELAAKQAIWDELQAKRIEKLAQETAERNARLAASKKSSGVGWMDLLVEGAKTYAIIKGSGSSSSVIPTLPDLPRINTQSTPTRTNTQSPSSVRKSLESGNKSNCPGGATNNPMYCGCPGYTGTICQ